jgi:hypothetical protein
MGKSLEILQSKCNIYSTIRIIKYLLIIGLIDGMIGLTYAQLNAESTQSTSASSANTTSVTPMPRPSKKKRKKKLKVSVKFSDSLTMEARNDNKNLVDDDDEYKVMINRLSLQSKIEKFTFDVKLNTIYFQDAPTDAYQSDLTNLERITAGYRYKRFQVYAGDFYQQLGFGQLLSLRKTDDFNLDIALRGGKLEYKSPRQSMITFAGFSNVINLDPVSQKYIDEKEDLMAGGQYEFRIKSGGEFGLAYLFLKPQEQIIDGADPYDATSSAGLFMNFPYLSDWLSIKAEADIQQRRIVEQVYDGYSAYTLIDTFYRDTLLQFEGLWVNNFEQRGSNNTALSRRFDYNLGPTLERIDQEVSEFYDVRGARVRLQHTLFNQNMLLYMNGLYRKNKANDPMEVNQYHGYAGLEYNYDRRRSKWAMSGGHRFDEQAKYINRVWSHAEGDYVQHLKGPYSTHFSTQLQRIRVEQQPFFVRGSTVLSLEKRRLGSLGFEWGVDTQNTGADARQMFYAGIIDWYIKDNIKLKALIGSQRGGIKCIGGVCRNFPAFSGVQVNLVINHFKLL